LILEEAENREDELKLRLIENDVDKPIAEEAENRED
jgi:hypothetical protein